MAEETLDAAVKTHGLTGGPSRTMGLTLEGGQDWTPTLYIRLVQDYGLENEVCTLATGGSQMLRDSVLFFNLTHLSIKPTALLLDDAMC